MIGLNQKIIGDKKIKNKAGGLANESRFYSTDRQKRTRKVCICPSVNTGKSFKFEQAWNKESVKRDVVKITLGDQYVICERQDLEQAIFAMAQGDELIKFTPPSF